MNFYESFLWNTVWNPRVGNNVWSGSTLQLTNHIVMMSFCFLKIQFTVFFKFCSFNITGWSILLGNWTSSILGLSQPKCAWEHQNREQSHILAVQTHPIMGHTWLLPLIITKIRLFIRKSSRLLNWLNVLLTNHLVMWVIVSSWTSQVRPVFRT